MGKSFYNFFVLFFKNHLLVMLCWLWFIEHLVPSEYGSLSINLDERQRMRLRCAPLHLSIMLQRRLLVMNNCQIGNCLLCHVPITLLLIYLRIFHHSSLNGVLTMKCCNFYRDNKEGLPKIIIDMMFKNSPFSSQCCFLKTLCNISTYTYLERVCLNAIFVHYYIVQWVKSRNMKEGGFLVGVAWLIL